MVLVIGKQAPGVSKMLIESGIPAQGVQAEDIPSLTALPAGLEITDIVILSGEAQNWSYGHVLAAAHQIPGKMVLIGKDNLPNQCSQMPGMVTVAADGQALLSILKEKQTTANVGGKNFVDQQRERLLKSGSAIRPLAGAKDKILFLGVIGSQPRIGCTTQAVGLWHYCRTLGFDPAVVSSPAQISHIAATMLHREIPGGCQVEGIPFIVDTARSYDCYILDIGAGDFEAAKQTVDILVLVAGTKPWEISAATAALRAVKGREFVLLLSFTSSRVVQDLRPLFGKAEAAAMPWMPDLWHPGPAAMLTYDALLRPYLERLTARSIKDKN